MDCVCVSGCLAKCTLYIIGLTCLTNGLSVRLYLNMKINVTFILHNKNYKILDETNTAMSTIFPIFCLKLMDNLDQIKNLKKYQQMNYFSLALQTSSLQQ